VFQHIPHYRRLAEELGLQTEDVTTLQDLSNLPLLSKDIIRENLQDLRADAV
jgi:phenylacetate-coenzyme A ligase PaaK-like adenylate-forming protein